MKFSNILKKAKTITAILSLPLIGGVGGGLLTSCEDMMTVDTGDKAYVNANDTLYSYLGIMRAMQDVAERQVILGEIRGDLVSPTAYTTDTLFAISNFDNPQDQSCSMLRISDYYNVINNCNFYINNADTSAIKSNIKYMIPEYTQVKAVRAWAYLQLVKNYGEVPYITEPVSNLDVVKNFDYANNLVNKDNLIEKLIADGLPATVDIKYPQYGDASNAYGLWNNGFTNINAHLLFVPVRLVLADAYLLRGQGKSDYTQAAQYYYEWLKGQTTPMMLNYVSAVVNRNTGKYVYSTSTGYTPWAATYNNYENEVITVIPGSANAGLGHMLTRVADIFGYTPSSSQSKDADTNADGENTGEYTASGAITVTRNYKRQYAPSAAYSAVNASQTYVNYPTTTGANVVANYYEGCDARYGISVEDYAYEGDATPLCCKAAKGSSFYYTIPTYRKTLVWLRLAEAINRAGYPEFAFAILKDGINKHTIPTIGDRFVPMYKNINGKDYRVIYNTRDDFYVYQDESAEEKTYYWYDAEGNFVPYTDGVSGSRWEPMNEVIPNDSIYLSGAYGAMYYVTDKEQIESFNSFLNFKDDVWNQTYGIHARGCGYGNWNAGVSATDNTTYARQTNISGYHDSIYYDYSKLLLAQNVELGKASQADIINAVENIIVDELALETCFEGNRFTDLVRVATHKNASGYNGTEWLATKIAHRSGQLDAGIYSKLMKPENWYFTKPVWNVK